MNFKNTDCLLIDGFIEFMQIFTFCRTGRCRTRWKEKTSCSDMKSKAGKKEKRREGEVSPNLSVNNSWGLVTATAPRGYLSLLEGGVDFFVLLKLLQLGLDQDLSDVHHLLHGESQALHRVTELLLQENIHHCPSPPMTNYILSFSSGHWNGGSCKEWMRSAAKETNTRWVWSWSW